MALKPLPKAIFIAVIVGAAGFGINMALPLIKKEAPVETSKTEAPIQIKTQSVSDAQELENAKAAEAARLQREQTPEPEAIPEPTQAPTTTNGGKGLDALLKAGKNK